MAFAFCWNVAMSHGWVSGHKSAICWSVVAPDQGGCGNGSPNSDRVAVVTGEAFFVTPATSCASGKSAVYAISGVKQFRTYPRESVIAAPICAVSLREAKTMSIHWWKRREANNIWKSGWTSKSGVGMNATQHQAYDVACILTSDWMFPMVMKTGCIAIVDNYLDVLCSVACEKFSILSA